MSERIRFTCVAHRRDGYWCEQDQAWVHADGWPCHALCTVAGPPEQSIWQAADGTCWFYMDGIGWTGWQAGEDGVWVKGVGEFRKQYPDAPLWDRAEAPR